MKARIGSISAKAISYYTSVAITIIVLANTITATDDVKIVSTKIETRDASVKISDIDKYSSPFLVLMSSGEISIAQLPLIDDGKVSVVYRAADSSFLAPSVKEKVDDESNSQEKLLVVEEGKTADAREYEQQMPSEYSNGLRKFFSPPITAGSKLVASSPPLSGRKNQEEVVGVKNSAGREKEEDGDGREKRQEGRRGGERKRRAAKSISVNDYQSSDHHHSPATSNKRHSLNQRRNASQKYWPRKKSDEKENPVVNFPPSLAVQRHGNVTSASFEADWKLRKKRDSKERFSPEADAKNSDAETVQFNDFDVHVAFGFVFVADCNGRVHKFRLNGFAEKETIVISPIIDHENLNLEDDVNTIGNGSFLSTLTHFSHPNSTTSASSSHKNSIASIHVGSSSSSTSPSTSSSNSDDEANKVSYSGSSSVAGFASHEQSSQHLSASGQKHPIVKQATVAFTSEQNSINHNARNDLTLRKQQINSQKLHELKSEKPKIIWSRIKRGSISSVAPKIPRENALLEPDPNFSTVQQHTQPPVEGALSREASSSNQTELSATETSLNSDDDQLAKNYSTNHMEEDGVSPLSAKSLKMDSKKTSKLPDETESEQASAVIVNSADECAEQLAPHFGTEIAVDWLNNVLFVLDKCRMVLVDFNGNNELVLIDDFDNNNRPIDIRVDPLNGLLFWLQVGTFENTIYRLNINAVADKYSSQEGVNLLTQLDRATGANIGTAQHCSLNQLAALTSRHYAHPIIYVLPQHAKLFTIDYKHSRIYVPLAPSAASNSTEPNKSIQQHQDDALVFDAGNSNHVTHMNNTSCDEQDDAPDCTGYDLNSTAAQIRAYKLDGTDRGLFRGAGSQIHLSDLTNLQDITLDSDKGLIYWLTNGGKDLLEELAGDSYQTAQHYLEGKEYKKLVHFSELNQPSVAKGKPKLRKMVHTILSANTRCRWIRNPSTVMDDHPSIEAPARLNIKHSSSTDLNETGNTSIFIIGITFLTVLSIYLIYAFIFQHNDTQSSICSRDNSIDGRSSMRNSHAESEVNPTNYNESGSFPRQMNRPNNSARDSEGINDKNTIFDLESTSYHESNAIDEHYRNRMNSPSLSELTVNRLANISAWPSDFNDMSNKLYVPVEVLQDDALASINRISIEQLEIERRNPLGEGNFGTVLQGVITCSVDEKNSLLNKPLLATNCGNLMDVPQYTSTFEVIQRNSVPFPSSSSSGHGSSLISTEFVTANSCEATSNDDYLTPKSNCNSNYQVESFTPSRPDSYSSYNIDHDTDKPVQTRFKVAIKKLKDNASLDEKRDFLQEAKLLANFNHPNIVQLIGICLDRGSTLIVMELMLGGDLIRYMQENTPTESRAEILTNDDLLAICLDIVNGCCYLEELNYIHRDLAARNCLVSSRKKEERIVKLADFGLARDIYKDSYYKKLNDSAMPLKWMAPECLIEQKFTIMSDVWSFGVVMWEVMSYCKEKPYKDVEPIFIKDFLTKGGRLEEPDNCRNEIFMLMNECWQMDPKVRPTFQECRATLIEIKNSRRS